VGHGLNSYELPIGSDIMLRRLKGSIRIA